MGGPWAKQKRLTRCSENCAMSRIAADLLVRASRSRNVVFRSSSGADLFGCACIARNGIFRISTARSAAPPRTEQEVVRSGEFGRNARRACSRTPLIRKVSAMTAEIRTEKIGSKWHGYIDGRPDIDETALTEEAVRGKLEQLRDRIGGCGATTRLYPGRTCELIKEHHDIGRRRIEHRSGGVTWIDGA